MNYPMAARVLLEDKTFAAALDFVVKEYERRLFEAPTPDERERIFQERAGLLRAKSQLLEWVSDLELEETK